MFVRSLLVAAVLVAFSAPASAYYCPKTGKAIADALSKNWKANGPRLSGAQIAEVKELRDQGMAQHSGGDHTAAVKALAEATRIILGRM